MFRGKHQRYKYENKENITFQAGIPISLTSHVMMMMMVMMMMRMLMMVMMKRITMITVVSAPTFGGHDAEEARPTNWSLPSS